MTHHYSRIDLLRNVVPGVAPDQAACLCTI